MLVSLIVPARNEEGNIDRLHLEVSKVIDSLPDYDFEVLVIDNDSMDGTRAKTLQICDQDPRWKYVKFTRDFGSEASIGAGLRLSRGDASIVLFSDLQDPPDKIPELLKQWRNGYDIVYGVYSGTAHEGLFKRVGVAMFYWVLRHLSDSPMVPFAGDFRLYDRRVVDSLNRLHERNRYMRGLAQWVGFRSTSIKYERRPRLAGRSKAPPLYLIGFGLSVLVNFSDKPLRILGGIAFTVFTIALALAGVLILNVIWQPVIPGLSTTHVLLTLNIGFTALCFSVLGEFVGKIYRETKGRPLWIIDESRGIDTSGNEFG